MSNIFSIDADTKAVIQDVLDDFLVNSADGGLGKTCLLVYPPRTIPCNNCVFDPITKRSSNRARDGGPTPFPPGTSCPMCVGKGLKEQEVTEEITLKCNWEPKKFFKPVPNLDVRVPNSIVETKGFLKDLPKILKAVYIIVNLPLAPFIKQKFTLLGEPGDPGNIIQGRYFLANWERTK